MGWDNECIDCGTKISAAYQRCYDCNSEYNSDEIPVAYESIKKELSKSWIFIIQGNEVQLPYSQCTLDAKYLTINVPRWLAEEKEIDGST